MLKSCKYCGRIHGTGVPCPQKPRQRKESDDIVRFRSSTAWKRMREAIQQRDGYLCRVCATKHDETLNKYQRKGLSVHHITPLEEDWSKRLDEDNLITLCRACHEAAERGNLERSKLRELAQSDMW